jgi:hypothetical protein
VRRLLLGAALLMLALAVVVAIAGRWGPALICAGAAFLAAFAWRMSGDLDPLWLTIDGDRLTVQMRRQRASLALRNVAARPLGAAERAHLASLTEAGGVTFASASYESRLLGAFDLHATDLERAVLVETDAPAELRDEVERLGERIAGPTPPPGDPLRLRWIVTPDDPGAFLTALTAAAAGPVEPAHGTPRPRTPA